MWFAMRALVVVAVFVSVGYVTDRAVLRHAMAGSRTPSNVRLAAAMGGLFAGGAAASVVVLGMAFGERR